jgi:hypothetical protein
MVNAPLFPLRTPPRFSLERLEPLRQSMNIDCPNPVAFHFVPSLFEALLGLHRSDALPRDAHK